MTSAKRLLFLTKGVAINPASRYRFLQYLPYFQQAGFETIVRPLFPESYYQLSRIGWKPARVAGKAAVSFGSLMRRMLDLRMVRNVDLVILENQVFPYEQGFLEELLFTMNKPVVIEFDDAIYLTPLHERKLLRILSKASQVIVGNQYLADFAKQASDRVSIVPTVIDMEHYPYSPPEEHDGPLRIGWVGMPSTLPYLLYMKDAFRKLAEDEAIELRIISSQGVEIEGVQTRFIPWQEDTESQEIAQLDIGVMPLPDTPWTRGKCGAKLLQYMASGRAAVASPVGVNAEIINHGQNGLLASSPEDWYHALRSLARNRSMRERMAAAARKRVERDYSLQSWAPRVIQVYKNLLTC